MTESLEFGVGPFTKLGNVRIPFFGKAFGVPNEVSKAGLAKTNPLLINAVAIADQNSFPALPQVFKGLA